MNEINVTAAPGVSEVILRTGSAMEVKPPIPVNVQGAITAPADFYEQRLKIDGKCFDQIKTLVQVNREHGWLKFYSNANDHYGDIITGVLTENQVLAEFRIGIPEPWRAADLAKFLRRRRFYFKDVAAGNLLISELSALKVSTIGQIESINDNRGNKRSLVEQAVKTDLPASVWLHAPIYIGHQPVSFEVEIYLDLQGSQVLCLLESPMLQQMRFENMDAILDGQIERFAKHDIQTTIIEV